MKFPAECYIDLNNFSERYTWDGSKRVKCNPAKAVFNPLEYLTEDWRMERSGVIGVSPRAGKTIEDRPLARVTFNSRSDLRNSLRTLPLYMVLTCTRGHLRYQV